MPPDCSGVGILEAQMFHKPVTNPFFYSPIRLVIFGVFPEKEQHPW